MELSKEQKLAIMRSKLQSLEQQKFSLELDVEVHKAINPEKDVPQSTMDTMKNVLVAIKILEEKLAELE